MAGIESTHNSAVTGHPMHPQSCGERNERVGAASSVVSSLPGTGAVDRFAFEYGFGRQTGELLARSGELLARVYSQLIDLFARWTSPPTAVPVTELSATEAPAPSFDAPTLTFAEKLSMDLRPGANNRVTETELRRGVVAFQLYQHSPSVSAKFTSYLESKTASGVPVEHALEKSLLMLVESGDLRPSDVNWIYSLSHRAAQLDSDQLTLVGSFDLKGAIQCAEATLAGIQAGRIHVTPLTLNPPTPLTR